VDIRYFAKLDQLWRLTDWEKVAALEPYHVWTQETIRERFAWNEDSCLHVALVRVFKLPPESAVWSFPYIAGYGGCRSWVRLPDEGRALEETLMPAMTDGAWMEIAGKVKAILQ
jgi:hypothetical protein